MPCFLIAIFSLMWFSNMADQLTNTPAEVKSTSHQKTVKAPSLRLMKLRSIKTQNNRTHMYGVPQDVVLKKILGAWPFSARPYLKYESVWLAHKRRQSVADSQDSGAREQTLV